MMRLGSRKVGHPHNAWLEEFLKRIGELIAGAAQHFMVLDHQSTHGSGSCSLAMPLKINRQ